jgi:hypothetical protein
LLLTALIIATVQFLKIVEGEQFVSTFLSKTNPQKHAIPEKEGDVLENNNKLI